MFKSILFGAQISTLTLARACGPSDEPGSTPEELVGDWESPGIDMVTTMVADIYSVEGEFAVAGSVIENHGADGVGLNQFTAAFDHIEGTTYELTLEDQEILVSYGDVDMEELSPVYSCEANFSSSDTLHCESDTHEFWLWRPEY